MTDTIQKLLRALADNDAPGLRHEDSTWTWREYVAACTARANALLDLADPDRPLHVGVLMENTPEMLMALGAGALGGYVTAGINTTRRGEGLARDVRKAECQLLLTDADHLPLLAGLDLRGAQVIDTSCPEWVERVRDAGRREHRTVEPGDTFMLIFTSGTSGDPKAVQVGNAMVVLAGAVLADRYQLTPDDTCYISMPLFHSNAVMSGFAVALSSGATMAVARKFSASRFLDDVRRYGATYMNYVGKPLAYVLATPRRPDDHVNPLRYAFGNEASEKDQRAFAERFGCEVWDGFGSTEAAIIITRVEGTPPESIGQPFDGVAVYDRATRTECPRAVFAADGRVTNLGEAVGELVNTQGAGYFGGYYNDAEATGERLDGGFYWSGDLAYRDADGFVYLAGRTSDWLRVDGENLAAGPVEQVLLRHPAVSLAAVYGIPDPQTGDQLVAALVLHPEHGLDPAQFEAFLAAQPDLSPKAWPHYVRIADRLPSTATNKVLKRELVRQGLDITDLLWERAIRGTSYTLTSATGEAR
jgi:fatty-acyl-CoA synthase